MTKVQPIPDRYASVTPHIVCKGVDKALAFYEKAFGAKDTVSMPGPDGKIMHAEMRIGKTIVMLGEENIEWGSKSPQTLGGTPVVLHVYFENVDQAFERAIKAGAKMKMPLTDMFWGDRYGQVTDPFGHVWSMAMHIKDMSPQEMDKAMKEQMSAMGKK